MKVTFSIRRGQESEKDGMFSKKQVDMYALTANFLMNDAEKKIYAEHPLFKEVVFMEYNEVDKWTTGVLFKDKHAQDHAKRIYVKEIYTNPDYVFRSYSVQRTIELREWVIEAGTRFATYIEILGKLEGTDCIEF